MLLLMGAGAGINHQDRDGNTALIWVARNANNAIMQLLIEAGTETWVFTTGAAGQRFFGQPR